MLQRIHLVRVSHERLLKEKGHHEENNVMKTLKKILMSIDSLEKVEEYF